MPPLKAAFEAYKMENYMRNESIMIKNPLWILKVIFGGIGIIMLLIGVILLIQTFDFIDSAVVVEAEITKIESDITNDGETRHRAYVDYEYNGEEYGRVKLDEYSESMYEGKKITVYIDSDNPGEVRLKSMVYFVPIVFMGLGALFFSIGAVFVVIDIKKKRKERALIKNGRKVFGEIQGGFADKTYRVNGKNPYRFKCTYYDVNSGQPVICISDRTWENPDMHVGKQVLIYVDSNDSSHYYVDLDSISKYG